MHDLITITKRDWVGVGNRSGRGVWKNPALVSEAWLQVSDNVFLRTEGMWSSPWLLLSCRMCSFPEPTPPSLEADIRPRGWKCEILPFLLFPAEHRPPSSAWRPAALTLLLLCLVLLIGLAALGFVCKSALWLGGGSRLQGLSRKRNIRYGIFLYTLILEPMNNSMYLTLKY